MTEELNPASAPSPASFTCPHCGQEVQAVAGPVAQLIACPHCWDEFVVPSVDGSTEVPEDAAAEERDDMEAELDGLRIRKLAKARRAAIRTRSYMLMLVAACIVGMIQLILNIVRRAREHDFGRKPIGYALAVVGLVILAVYFARRAQELHRESKQSALAEPETPPDFTDLSDGTQHWKSLQEMEHPADEQSPPPEP